MSKIMNTLLFVYFLMAGGCHSYFSLTQNENREPILDNSERAIITLVDGSTIETEPLLHFEVKESTEVISGYGMRCKGITNIKPFCGTINVSSLDSLGKKELWGNQYFVCWFKDGSYVKFRDEDYLHILRNSEQGLWCIGKLKTNDGNESFFKGVLRPNDIREIMVENISVQKTIFLLLLTLPPIIYSYLFVTYERH